MGVTFGDIPGYQHFKNGHPNHSYKRVLIVNVLSDVKPKNTHYHKFVFWFPQANDLTPQVVKAARIVLLNPNNAASVEHFDLLKKQWTENMEKLRGLVDEATDTVAFIKATGQY